MKTYMSPAGQAKHREATKRQIPFDSRTLPCPGCRRSRSRHQFVEHKLCRQCRGLK